MSEETKEVRTCQHCKSQKNNPSYCSLSEKYVGRKQETCDNFKPKGGGKR